MSHLTQEQRYKIEALKQENIPVSVISKQLNRHKSVIYRELNRNCDPDSGIYNGGEAHRRCLKKYSFKNQVIYFHDTIKEYVDKWLLEDYSPEQISGKAKLDKIFCVSPERIYQYIWQDKKEGGELYKHLRTQGKRYRYRGASKDKRGQIVGRIGIEKRPKEVEEKLRFGDLEMDLVVGKDHKQAMLTINDRATGMLKMVKVPSKEATVIEKAAIELLKDWKPFIHTITSDNGKEFARHQSIANELVVDYFFANPYRSWERGANENLNGLVRQYLPKGSEFLSVTNERVQEIVEKLNNRPRKRFGFRTPNEVYLQTINNNGIVALVA